MVTVLRPSAAPRWFNCTKSVELSKGLPDLAGEDAVQGTVAHALLEQCLSNGEVDANDYVGQKVVLDVDGGYVPEIQADIKDGKLERVFTADHVSSVNVALDTVWQVLKPEDHLFVEKKIDCLPEVSGPVGAFVSKGTPDVRLHVLTDGVLWVFDLKHGFVLVEPDSEQLLVYAAGAFKAACDDGHVPNTVKTVIIQPRAPHPEGQVRTHTMSA